MRRLDRFLRLLLLLAVLMFGSLRPVRADAPPNRYTIDDQSTASLADDTVYDTRTQLTWQRQVPGSPSGCSGAMCTQAQAASYCSGLSLDGSGWRLPKASELQSIVDYSLFNPAIDRTAFPSTPAQDYWTSTVQVGVANHAHMVTFFYGESNHDDVSALKRVRCVR